MAHLFRRRSKGEGNSTSSRCLSLSEGNKAMLILSSEIEPPASATSKAATSGIKEIGDPSLPTVALLSLPSISKADKNSATAAVAAGTLEDAAAGALTAPFADRSVKKQYGQDGDGAQCKEAEGGRKRSGSVGNLLLSSMTSFSKGTSLSFLTGEDKTPSPPETGPAGIDFSTPAHPTMQFVDFIITFLLVHYIQVFYSLVFLFIYLVKHGHRWPYFLAAIYAPSYFIPLQRLGGWPFKGFMRRPFWRCVQRTLALQVEREVELSPDEQYIFGWHPHGILLLSRFAIYGGLWEKLFPGIHFKTLAASPLFWIPPIREVSILLGGVDAGRASAARALTDGYSVSLYPGGSKEIYTTDPYTPETTLVLKIRKGFIRMALRYGCALVPVYTFGEKYAYHRLGQATGFARWLLAVLKVPFLIFWGRWGTFMPLKETQVSVVVGTPLRVPKIEGEPSPEVVEEWLHKYCDEVQALFRRHKHKYAKPEEFVAIS
uniref:Acyltransferase n=1 Tax=Nannochloropsis oceanica strain IMET1 TaxID=1333499 RepID=A0A290G0P3_9STRA|nr:diacylglycerol acyltransferase [Nannochloropsis oceanica strain IMET1]